MYDVVIIGAGVVGAAIGRLLSQYDLKVAMLEKEADVSLGASKGNSGIIHGGYVGKKGTLKGALCIKGNRMYDQLNKELSFGFKRIGGLILGFEGDHDNLEKQYNNGKAVGETMFWLTKEAVLKREPSINPDVQEALYVKNIGIASPYEMTIALVENAIQNGVTLYLNHHVDHIEGEVVSTNKGDIEGRYIINAAGKEANIIHNHINSDTIDIKFRRGQYIVLSKSQNHLSHVIFQAPSKKGKGVLVTPTVHGNLMIGPDAEDLLEDLNTDTSIDRLKYIVDQSRHSTYHFDLKQALTSYAGIRSTHEEGDFIIQWSQDNVITLAGIDSPGLTAAPAIAEYVRDMLNEKLLMNKKPFDESRKSYYSIENDDIICLCENQGASRIKHVLEGPIPIDSTDAVKRRVRAGMGTCQGARCFHTVRQIIADKHQIPIESITKRTEKHMPKRVPLSEIKNLV